MILTADTFPRSPMTSINSKSPRGAPPSASRYELIEEIGVGSYGTVYRGIDSSTGKEVAIKEVDLEDVHVFN